MKTKILYLLCACYFVIALLPLAAASASAGHEKISHAYQEQGHDCGDCHGYGGFNLASLEHQSEAAPVPLYDFAGGTFL